MVGEVKKRDEESESGGSSGDEADQDDRRDTPTPPLLADNAKLTKDKDNSIGKKYFNFTKW